MRKHNELTNNGTTNNKIYLRIILIVFKTLNSLIKNSSNSSSISKSVIATQYLLQNTYWITKHEETYNPFFQAQKITLVTTIFLISGSRKTRRVIYQRINVLWEIEVWIWNMTLFVRIYLQLVIPAATQSTLSHCH